MAGNVKVNAVQLGDSATATQNFVLQTNVDGTAKLARGNVGATTQDILTVGASGNVTVTSAAGLGYGTGAGGAVTQLTSKTTAVTLNKPTGRITMDAAALAAGASVIFVFNNALIAVADTLVVNTLNDGSHLTQCVCTLAGQAYIRVTNISAGSLSTNVPINFAVIKGATS